MATSPGIHETKLTMKFTNKAVPGNAAGSLLEMGVIGFFLGVRLWSLISFR